MYEIDEYRNLFIPECLRKYMGEISRDEMLILICSMKNKNGKINESK